MSGKKSGKSKKSTKDSKTTDETVSTAQTEPVSELFVRPVDIRTIVITVDSYGNILPLFPVSDIKASLTYLDKEVGESQVIPVIDDPCLTLDESFEFEIDINNPREVDLLASNPVMVSVVQLTGSLDPEIYEELRKSNEATKPVEDVDSLFSMYEAFTGEKVTVQLADLKKKKKGKKEKSVGPTREKTSSQAKSVTSKGSKSSKKSKNSKSSVKTDSQGRIETVTIKSEIYGMCVIDLIPLFLGDTSFTETLHIHPIKKSCETLSTFKNSPEISITVSIKEHVKLLDNIKNILYMTVESVCNIPSLMITDMDCTICAMLPLQNNTTAPALFYNPKITNTAPSGQIPKRWPGIHDIGFDANTTKYVIDTDYELIDNKSKLDIEEGFCEEATRIEFNYLKRNVLFKSSHCDFVSHISTYKKVVLEIYLTHNTKKSFKTHGGMSDEADDFLPTKARVSKEPPHLHLMAVLDVATLLYPGMTKLRIAAPVTTFTYEEAAKMGLSDSFFFPKPSSSMAAGKASKADASKKKKTEKKDIKESKKDKNSLVKDDKNLAGQLPPKPEEPIPPEPSVQVYTEEGKPCFILVEIELLESLVTKRDVAELKSDLHELQLQALQSSKIILNKNVADDLYHQTIREIVDDLNKNWIKYNEAINTIPPPGFADFLEYLNKIGAFQAYLNSITTSATLLITNKYKCDETDFKNSKTYQNLTSEVFTDLISQMHGVLNSLVCSGMKPLQEKYNTPWELSFFYAKEAAELNLYKLADRYFVERIINDTKGNSSFWFDYAIYNIEINNADKAFECTKESIAISCTNKYALLLYGALLTDKEDKNDAEICLLNIMVLESRWVEGWCVLYLFYQKCGRLEGMEMAMDKAKKTFDLNVISDFFVDFEDLAWSYRNIPNTIFFRTAILLLKMRLYSWVELALAEEVLVPKHYGYVNYMLAVVSYYQNKFDHALEHIEEAKEHAGADFAILGISGHVLLAKGELESARDEYFRIIETYDRPDDIHLVYLNCAEILLQLGEDQKARNLILTTCKTHQTPHVWFSAGKVYFQQNDMLSAEECFNEANMKDNKHPEVWGYLTLVNLKLNRMHEAEQCYQQAIKSNLDNESLNLSIIKEFSKAKSLY